MFGNLIALDYKSLFDVATASGIMLVVGCCLIGVLLIGYALIFAFKRNAVGKYLFAALALTVAYAVSVALVNISADASGGETYVKKYQMWLAIGLAALVLVLVVAALAVDGARKKKLGLDTAPSRAHTLEVAYAGICIAAAFGLSYVKMFKAPYGGSITLASLLPIALYSYIFGWKKGLLCGLIYGLLQSMQDPWIVHPAQYLLDYPLAFGFVGLCGGLFRNTFKFKNQTLTFSLGLTSGILVGVFFRYICHVLSGAIFFGEYMPDTFANVWVYSFSYNALYVFPDAAVAIVAGVLLLSSSVMRRQISSVRARCATVVKDRTVA